MGRLLFLIIACLITVSAYCQPLIEAKAGYFFFTESQMRKVYDHGGLDLQISGSYPLDHELQLYGSVEYLEKSGHSLNGHQRTTIWEIPLSLGPQLVFRLRNNVKYYFTIGPRYFFVRANNCTNYITKRMHANGMGGFANTGFLFIFRKHFTLDLFGEYSYARLHFHSKVKKSYGQTVQVGGLTFGAGVGYTF